MRPILRNEPPVNMLVPDTLENLRKPEEYKAAVVKDHNDRWTKAFVLDPAKARVLNVRQNSFKKWEAFVTLGQDIYEDGKVVGVQQQNCVVTRTEMPIGTVEVERKKGETAFVTWEKVAEALGLEPIEVVAKLDLSSNAYSAVYEINPQSLNHYGTVNVRFNYVD